LYTVEIKCSPPSGVENDKNKNDKPRKKQVTFCDLVTMGETYSNYNRKTNISGNQENKNIKVWFEGQTRRNTHLNKKVYKNKRFWRTCYYVSSSPIIKDVNSYLIPRGPQQNPLTGCAKINSDYLQFKAKIIINYEDVKNCYESLPYNNDIAVSTIETIKSTLTQFYIFLDQSKENPQPGFTFTKQDIIAELDALLQKSYTSDFQFFTDLQNLVSPLKDGHLSIRSECYSIFAFDQKLSLYSSVKQDGTQVKNHMMNEANPTNIDCEVTQIDNQPALQFIIDYATTEINGSKDLGVRFNLALASLSLLNAKAAPAISSEQFTRRFGLPKNANYTYTLQCSNATDPTAPVITKTITRSWVVKASKLDLDSGGLNDTKTFFETFCLKDPKLVNVPKSPSFIEELEPSMDDLYEIDLMFDQKVTQGVLIFDAAVLKFYLLPNNIGVAVIGRFSPLDKKFARFFIALLSPDSKVYGYPVDMKLTELTLLAIKTAAAASNGSTSFDPRNYVDAKTLYELKTADDLIGNNFKTRGGVTSRYTNKFSASDSQILKEMLGNNTNPLPWKSTDYVILSNGFCGSSCANVAQILEELWNVTTVAVGGLYGTPLSYASFAGGQVTNLEAMLDDLQTLGITSANNKLVPKGFLTKTNIGFPYKEVYSYKGEGEIVMEYDFRPAKYRIYYDAESIRDPSKLWLQAVVSLSKKALQVGENLCSKADNLVKECKTDVENIEQLYPKLKFIWNELVVQLKNKEQELIMIVEELEHTLEQLRGKQVDSAIRENAILMENQAFIRDNNSSGGIGSIVLDVIGEKDNNNLDQKKRMTLYEYIDEHGVHELKTKTQDEQFFNSSKSILDEISTQLERLREMYESNTISLEESGVEFSYEKILEKDTDELPTILDDLQEGLQMIESTSEEVHIRNQIYQSSYEEALKLFSELEKFTTKMENLSNKMKELEEKPIKYEVISQDTKLPMLSSKTLTELNDQLINVKEEESLSLFKPGKHCKPRHPPSHRKSHRAYALFTNPPDVIKGALLFWETLENGTFVVGQFSEGFLKGEEEDYTFKIYQSSKEIFDLKPKNESFDKIFKVRSNNSTDSFLFNVNETLITSGDIVGSYLVIGKPGALLGKSKIHYLPL
ncbi:19420_t:CDS:10, partial [Entrophospora sp. SA101]